MAASFLKCEPFRMRRYFERRPGGGSTKKPTSEKRQQIDALACLWAQILSD